MLLLPGPPSWPSHSWPFLYPGPLLPLPFSFQCTFPPGTPFPVPLPPIPLLPDFLSRSFSASPLLPLSPPPPFCVLGLLHLPPLPPRPFLPALPAASVICFCPSLAAAAACHYLVVIAFLYLFRSLSTFVSASFPALGFPCLGSVCCSKTHERGPRRLISKAPRLPFTTA